MTEKENCKSFDLIELRDFLRDNPPGYKDGKSMIALTPEQVNAEKLESEERSKTVYVFQEITTYLDDTVGEDRSVRINPTRRTRGI